MSTITQTQQTPELLGSASQRSQALHPNNCCMVLTSLTRPDQLPQTNINVNGKETTFLVDSGANHSVLSSKEWKYVTKLSGRVIQVVGAGGQPFKEKFTVPLSVRDGDKQLKHSFLLSDQCPTNLLGRDLMCRLGLSVICTDAGLTVTSNASPMIQAYSCVARAPGYFYSWDLLREGPGAIADILITTAHHCMQNQPEIQYMPTDNLHCTARMSYDGQIAEVEEHWYKDDCETAVLMGQLLLWNEKCCMLTVASNEEVKGFFRIPGSAPHVSLAKNPDQTWAELGPWAVKGGGACDWIPDPHGPEGQYFSPATGLRHRAWGGAFETRHSVQKMRGATGESPEYLLPQMTVDDPRLAEVPPTLWAKSKYDVGCIQNVEPLMVTPKSTYRPKQPQYRLRQEAIDGITPVFNSLLEAGVIIPCPYSPCCTPIFPVKKAPVEGQPTAWRFVQDLKKVNDAVHPRTPIVPDPHTLLTQVPGNSKWFSVVDLANAFFSIPVDPASQFWFAFQFNGKPYTWTRMPQGYCESPAVFSAALHDNLDHLILPGGSTLIQ